MTRRTARDNLRAATIVALGGGAMPPRFAMTITVPLVCALALAAPAEGDPRHYRGPREGPIGTDLAPFGADAATAAELPAPEPEPAIEIEPEPEPEGPSELDSYDPMRDSPEALRAQRWITGGVLFSLAGVAVGTGAIVMAASDPCNPAAGNSCQSEARDRAALTMGIPAAGFVLGGIAMIVVGKVRLNRLKVGLSATRTGAGLRVGARF